MLGNFSDKAIAAKARAMYGRRVTRADYEELMKKRTVGDTAVYLRDNTHYREVLGQIDPAAIHRGQLEHQLRSLRYIQYRRLIAFNFGQQDLYRYIYAWDESRQLVALLRFLGRKRTPEEEQGGRQEQYQSRYDRRLAASASYDLVRMVQVKSYRELLDFFGDSPYGRIIRRFPPDATGQIDMVGCEQAISTYYYNNQLALADRELSGDARKAMREMFLMRIGTQNLAQAYRLKRFFRSDPAFIRKSLLPFETPFTKVTNQVIDAGNIHEIHAILERSGVVMAGGGEDTDFIDRTVQGIRAKESKTLLRNCAHPPVVLHAYIAQLELELGNVINIIESVRYGLPTDEIRQMLVL